MTITPEPVLPLSLLASNRDKFNALFYDTVSVALQKKTNLHVHVLRVQNGNFDLAGLYRELKNNSVAYVLSRLNYKKALEDPGRLMEVAEKVRSQFRIPDEKAGEGGEVILYSLLEGHLGAPKVLSKMELKTNSDHYVYGSDGVHLLRAEDSSYQLIFGESKMYGDSGGVGTSAKRGIKAAFKSVGKVHDEGFDFDTWLVQSELLKEELDEAKLAALAAILLPSRGGGDDAIKKHNAFGIFVGYEIDVSDMKNEDMELDEIEAELQKRATEAITAQHDLIKQEIIDRGLGIYPIHLYAVPFAKRGTGDKVHGITQIRMELAAQLGNHGASK
ncbi:HamA C-terminal domain-containing protein [Plantibacter sp. 2H11-2]|uniref:HamA C-terminal domain-containing protein n=1 Tax=Plantibacter sp. 2H11-2 TaxID=3414431 RepID=UPI003CECD46A